MHDPFHPSSILFTQLFFHYQDFKTLHNRSFRPFFNLIPLKNHKTHLHQLNKNKYKNTLPTFFSSNIFPTSPPIQSIPSIKIPKKVYKNKFQISNFPANTHTSLKNPYFLLSPIQHFLLKNVGNPHRTYFHFSPYSKSSVSLS